MAEPTLPRRINTPIGSLLAPGPGRQAEVPKVLPGRCGRQTSLSHVVWRRPDYGLETGGRGW